MARHSAATAVILMLCAAVFDLFDGLVARKLRPSPWARSWTTSPT